MPRMIKVRFVTLLTTLLGAGLLTACGGKKSDGPAKDDAPAGPTVAPIATPQIGVDAIKRMGFVYGDGWQLYDKAVDAYRAKARDWSAIRSNTEAALAKDPYHLDAHRLLGTALAHAGEHAAAVDHLVTALAGDYWKYGPSLTTDNDLKEFLATPHGTAILEVGAKIRAEYVKRIASAVLLVGRRSAFKWPKDPGVQAATSRGELYAFDRETRRYLRLTHTEHQIVGVVRAPSGSEVAILGFEKIDRPKGTDDAPPLLARTWVQILDTTEWKPLTWKGTGTRIQIGGGREASIGYGAGDQLLVATAPADGRWGVGAPVVSSIDKSTGKLTKVASAPPTPRIVFSLEEGRRVRVPEGIVATWAGEPPTAPSLAIQGGAAIPVPESGAAAQPSIALSPDKTRTAFATAVDPCAENAAPSLYVADTKTGALKHLLTSKSRFATRWLDATTLAYEDGDGAIRLWDATTGREAMRLENKPGIALEVLSLAAAPLCKQAPPVAEPAGSGDEPPPMPMPPEETPGPVVTPQ